MSREIKLKELLKETDYKATVNNSDCSPLTKWFSEILEKPIKELSNFDMIRCIRQNIFVDEIVEEIILRMLESRIPFYSDDDFVELMGKLALIDISILKKYKDKLRFIFSEMERNNLIETTDFWIYEEEKEEFREYISKIKQKLFIN